MKKQQNKKRVLDDKILKILIGLLILVTALLVVFLVINLNKVDIDSPEIVALHNYFNSEKIKNCDGLFNYANNKVEYNNVKSANRLCIAYQSAEIKDVETGTLKADKKKSICTFEKGKTFKVSGDTKECSYTKIKRTYIDKSYMNLFGYEIEDNESFKIDNKNICYLKDNYYYCGEAETQTYVIGGESLVYRVIDKAVEKGSEIIIYDYFVRINSDQCYKNYTTAIVNEKCTEMYENKAKINYKFMKQYGTPYKHIYRENENGTYYWVSSEPIK